ncbi:MAG: hypothetical protein JW795_05415, partial [Chitinivibrionales bacterium]|nr:hypothetical protein [Chitinivibrionales bacterium]
MRQTEKAVTLIGYTLATTNKSGENMHTLGTVILILITFASIVGAQSNITHTGIRASKYGIKVMPTARGYHNAIWAMNTYFPGTIPTIVWTVTEADGEVPEKMFDCRFYFP